MTINASARNYRIWICTPTEDEDTGLEVTAACVGDGAFFSVTDEPQGEDGLQRTTGELNLLIPYGEDDTYNPWENPERWAIGNRILVKVADESGTLRWHPRSGLYILSDPEPPYPGNWQIRLEIGDRLSLLSFRQPHADASAVDLGQAKTRTAIASDILSKVGLELDGTIPGSLNYPIPKTQNSFVQQAGAVAIAGASFLWQDSNGVIQARAIDLLPRTRLFKHEVGRDDAGDYRPIQGSERPVSKFRVVGTGYKLIEPSSTTVTISQEYAPASTIDPDAGDRQVLIAVYKKVSAWQGTVFVEIIQERRARGLVIPEDVYKTIAKAQGIENYEPPSPFQLIYSHLSKEARAFEDSKEGRLLYIDRFVEEPEGAALGEYYKRNPPAAGDITFSFGGLSLVMPTEDSRIVYSYSNSADRDEVRSTRSDTAGQVRKIYSLKKEPRAKIAATATDWRTNLSSRKALISSERIQSSWARLSPDEWLYQEINQRAGQIRSGTVAGFSALRVIGRTKTISRSGDAQPPSAERRQPLQERKEVRYKGEAEFRAIAGSAYSPRIQTVNVDYLTSDNEAARLARIFGLKRVGRHRGFAIVTTLRDEWFDYEPLSRIDVAWNGYVYLGVTDLVTWTLAGDEAIVEAHCLRMGRSPGAKGTPDPYVAGEPPPLQPVAQVLEEFAIVSVNRIDWVFFPIKVGVLLPERTFEIGTVNRIAFNRSFVLRTVSDIAIRRAPILEVRTVNRFAIEAAASDTPIAYWPLESSPWNDSIGGYTLTPINLGGSVTATTGLVGNAAQFSGNAYLRSTATALQCGNIHWKLEFSIYLTFATFGARIYRESDTGGWEVETITDIDRFRFNVYSAGFGSVQSLVSSVSLTTGTWYSVIVELNPSTGLSITVNGTVDSASLTLTPADAPTGEFGIAPGAAKLVDEVKFYKF